MALPKLIVDVDILFGCVPIGFEVGCAHDLSLNLAYFPYPSSWILKHPTFILSRNPHPQRQQQSNGSHKVHLLDLIMIEKSRSFKVDEGGPRRMIIIPVHWHHAHWMTERVYGDLNLELLNNFLPTLVFQQAPSPPTCHPPHLPTLI
jgi:hypothetical protein